MHASGPARRGIILIVFLSLGIHMSASDNIALIADTILTSHVSPWEDLFTINNGIDPVNSGDKTGGAYGNWNSADNNRWHWVEYNWDALYRISRSDVYWWVDGLGIVIPYDTYQEYWDFMKGEWVELPGAQGNGTEADAYNITVFSPVLTNKIRVHMISEIATGILEWRVWGEIGEQVPRGTSIEIDPELSRNDSSEVLIVAKDEDYVPVPGYVFILDIDIKNDLPGIDEVYSVAGSDYTESYFGFQLPPSNQDGETRFKIIIPEGIDYRDGISVQVLFSDSLSKVGDAFSIYEPGLDPPLLSPDTSDNSVDHTIELTYTDDADWRTAIKAVYADDTLLSPSTDYEIQPGIILLKPGAGNTSLTAAEEVDIRVEAWGYEDNTLVQQILPGKANATGSSAATLDKLFRHTSTNIEIIARDTFLNVIPAYTFEYDIRIIDNDATTGEVYRVAGEDVTSDIGGLKTLSTDPDGRVLLSLAIPGEVDLNDGIEITIKTAEGSPLDPRIVYVYDGTEKQVLVQSAVKSNPGFSWERTAQSDNFVIFWGDEINGDPGNRELNGNLWFSTSDILGWMEDIRTHYMDSLGFLDPAGNDSRYKHEIVMNETWSNGQFTGWAFGGGVEDTHGVMTIGAIWVHPNATRDIGVISHEFTHACQYMVMVDRPGYGLNTPYAGFFWESHANFMSYTYRETRSGIPERFIYTAMMQYSTTRRHYQNLPFLDYLYDTYGMETINKIWHNADRERSHPLTSLRDSVLRYSQDNLHDDFVRHAMRNITWDYEKTGNWWKRAVEYIPEYRLGRLYTILDTLRGHPGKFIVPEHLAPADYGYNLIQLYPDSGATRIEVEFQGLHNAPAGGAGSRYGFVAVDTAGKARYSELYTQDDNAASFDLQAGDSAVFMVVTGAPVRHHNYAWEVGYPKSYRYPYIVQFSGALPAGHKPGYNSRKEEYPGAPHPNGGGWVASTAQVAATAYVGPNAQVLGNAVVSGNARIEGYAIVTDNTRVRDNAVVKDHAIVYDDSNIGGNAVVEKTARLNDVNVNNNAVVSGSALLWNFTLNGDVIVKDLAILWNGTLSGTTLVGGDAEEYSGCSSGTYMEIKRLGADCDGRIYHTYNVEVNPAWPEYTYPMGDNPSRPINISARNINSNSLDLHWDAAEDDAGILGYAVMQKRSSQVLGLGIASENSFRVTGLSGNTSYSFFVQAIDGSGNFSRYSDTVNVRTAPTAVEGMKGTPVKVYPNPAPRQIHVQVPQGSHYLVRVYNLLGREVFSGQFTESIIIESSAIGGPGIYIVKVAGDLTEYSTKILVNE